MFETNFRKLALVVDQQALDARPGRIR
jgi:hypothetical protein